MVLSRKLQLLTVYCGKIEEQERLEKVLHRKQHDWEKQVFW